MTQPTLNSNLEDFKKSLVGQLLVLKSIDDAKYINYIVVDIEHQTRTKYYRIIGYDIEYNKTTALIDLVYDKISCLTRCNIIMQNSVILKVIK